MNGPAKLVAPLVAALALAACNGGSAGVPAAAGGGAAGATGLSTAQDVFSRMERSAHANRACPGDRMHGMMQCDALIESSGMTHDVPGWSAASLEAAYNLPITKGSGQVVAVVDAYDNPNVTTDLAEYRSGNSLPTGTFYKYNQTGQQSNYPTGNKGWGVEIDLDVDMVSAACPQCTIILVEADDNSTKNLNAAEVEAVKLGAHVVTNSWGGGGGQSSKNSFDTPGVQYLASSGDGGYGMQDPADFVTVNAIGGTILSFASNKYTEYVWPSSGGGCSVVSKPKWQKDPGCTKRTGNEVSAVAQGVSEYDTYGYGVWIVIGGTSVSSPFIAGVFGLAGNAAKFKGPSAFWTMKKGKRAKALHTISSGNDHCPSSLSGSYLCTAGTGQFGTYAGPTGWGTPNGIGAF